MPEAGSSPAGIHDVAEPVVSPDTGSGHVAAPALAASTAHRARQVGLAIARVGGLMIAVLALMAVFAALSDGRFLITANLLGMLRYMSTIAILGLGLTVVLVIGEIDLSFANLYGLTAMVTAVAWISWGWHIGLALLFSLVVAIAWGCFNALLVAIVKVPAFIATLGSSILIFGFTLYVSKSRRFSPAAPPKGTIMDPAQVSFFRGLSNRDLPFKLPMQMLWMIGCALIFGYLLARSLFGFRLKAIGGSQIAARFARLPVTKYKFLAFGIMAVTAFAASTLDFAFIGSVQPDAGQQLLFPVFAAVIIGGASLQGGRGTVVGTLTGALLLAVISNGLALLAAGAFVQQMVLGGMTIGAVLLDQLTQRLR